MKKLALVALLAAALTGCKIETAYSPESLFLHCISASAEIVDANATDVINQCATEAKALTR